MKKLYIKQKVLSMGGKFNVKDEQGQDVYQVEGSFMRIPKTFIIKNTEGEEVASITKKPFSFLPTFFVNAGGRFLGISAIRKKCRWPVSTLTNLWIVFLQPDYGALKHGKYRRRKNYENHCYQYICTRSG